MWEEPGWSGYALPTLQERFSGRPNGTLIATLGTGVVRAIWHLPLVIYGHIPWYDALFFTLAFQIMISWLFNGSGSVLVVMVFHFASNISGAIMAPVFTGADRTSYYVLFVILAWVIALIILWRSNLMLGLAGVQKKRAIVGDQAA
jgi:membrane protease YdiL (CAAX protease family)